MSDTQVDYIVYYKDKKKEVGNWLFVEVKKMKKLTNDQRGHLLKYCENMTFKGAGEFNAYLQELPTVTKKEKKTVEGYLQNVDWLPEGVNIGVLDGEVVSRVLPSPLERLLGDKVWISKKE